MVSGKLWREIAGYRNLWRCYQNDKIILNIIQNGKVYINESR